MLCSNTEKTIDRNHASNFSERECARSVCWGTGGGRFQSQTGARASSNAPVCGAGDSPAAKAREVVSVHVDDVDVGGALREALFQDLEALVDQGEEPGKTCGKQGVFTWRARLRAKNQEQSTTRVETRSQNKEMRTRTHISHVLL